MHDRIGENNLITPNKSYETRIINIKAHMQEINKIKR